jgi:hypothetical protein
MAWLRYYFDAQYGGGGEAMFRRSNSAYERALILDPNLINAASQIIANRTEAATSSIPTPRH